MLGNWPKFSSVLVLPACRLACLLACVNVCVSDIRNKIFVSCVFCLSCSTPPLFICFGRHLTAIATTTFTPPCWLAWVRGPMALRGLAHLPAPRQALSSFFYFISKVVFTDVKVAGKVPDNEFWKKKFKKFYHWGEGSLQSWVSDMSTFVWMKIPSNCNLFLDIFLVEQPLHNALYRFRYPNY